MKRFLLFAYDAYYPGGGWADFKGDFDSLEDAEAAAKTCTEDYRDIIDSETKSICCSSTWRDV